jgi:crotonobetaine/carnitine-CoA ligase
MFEGYADNPEATVAVLRNLWFHTGDLGSIDADGYLTFVGRAKDALRRRGENVSAFELEEAIRKHVKIAEVAVHAVPSEFSEDEIKACIMLVEGAEMTHREVLDYCVEQVPYFAVPRYFEFMKEFPRNMSNRVTKYVLEERGVTPETWDREAEGIIIRRPKR